MTWVVEQSRDEQGDHKQRDEQHADAGEEDGPAYELRPLTEDAQLDAGRFLRVGVTGARLVGQSPGPVDDAAQPVRHGQQEQADAGDHHDRTDRLLQHGD